MQLRNFIATTIREYLIEQELQSIDFDKDKKKQLGIILKTNPMLDDYHTGIRTLDDIKTLNEILLNNEEDDLITFPDFTIDDIKKAVQTKEIFIYSSYPIQDGTFVTPSKMEAKSHAGNNNVYSKYTSIYNIAWIDSGEGMFTKIK
jgi:hypothetical protein